MSLLPATAAQWYHALLLLILGLCPIVFGTLLLLPAAYGRRKQGHHWLWGPGIPTRWAWALMESPSSLGFAVIYFCGDRAFAPVPLILLLMWQSHYFERSFIYPLLMNVRPGDATPAAIPVLGMSSNLVISFLNASILSWSDIGGAYSAAWLTDPRFVIGALLFVVGYHINRKADAMLAALRKPGETGYSIPRGWLYEKVTCPNYLGEFLIWIGWAIATWSSAGLAFMLWTFANLAPRALANHRWYRRQFPDYPPARKAVIPFLL